MCAERMWLVNVWDGFSNRSFYRKGTYDYVYNQCVSRAPPGYIVTVS